MIHENQINMQERDQDAISKLVKRYEAGESLNAADGKHFHVQIQLPGVVSDDLTEKEQSSKIKHDDEKAYADSERERTVAFLERQRKLDLQDKSGQEARGKIDYSIMNSEINMLDAKNFTLSIAAAISRCSKIMLELDDKTEAAISIPSIDHEQHDDFRSSTEQLVRCHFDRLA
jgi:hypothetical protein